MRAITPRLVATLRIGSILLIVSLLVYWGGTARPGPLFIVGVAMLLSLVFAFGLMTWWLFWSPLPLTQEPALPLPWIRRVRQAVVFLVLTSNILFIAGSVWDEVWHRKFGSFGDDFLWPPHLMIYGSFFIIALFSGCSLLVLVRGHGNLRQRFRREPLIGLLAIVAAYLIASLPVDQLWHEIYGKDITAWSLPHITIMSGSVMISLVAATIQRSLLPADSHNVVQESIILLLLSIATGTLLQLGTTEWEGITQIPSVNTENVFRQAFWSRPEWLYPVVLITIAVLFGMLALSIVQRAGAATVVALLAICLRTTELTLFDGWMQGVSITPYILILPPMITLDLWYILRSNGHRMFQAQISGSFLAGMVAIIVSLLVIAQTMVYPRINSTTLPGIVLFGMAVAIYAGWAGASIGSWMMGFIQQSAVEEQAWSVGSPVGTVS